MYVKGDFHIHSRFSDGRLWPSEIVDESILRGIDIISITDHNTMNGVAEGIEYGLKKGIRVIPGVEVSARYESIRVHILGYFNNDLYKKDIFKEFLMKNKKGDMRWIKNNFGEYIKFNEYRKKLYVGDAIRILKLFGAIVVLAHPVLIPEIELKKIIKLPFDGIEAKYYRNKKGDTKRFIKIASKNKLIYTAGSDFHKLDHDYKHGMIGDVYLDKNEIKKFLNYMEKESS